MRRQCWRRGRGRGLVLSRGEARRRPVTEEDFPGGGCTISISPPALVRHRRRISPGRLRQGVLGAHPIRPRTRTPCQESRRLPGRKAVHERRGLAHGCTPRAPLIYRRGASRNRLSYCCKRCEHHACAINRGYPCTASTAAQLAAEHKALMGRTRSRGRKHPRRRNCSAACCLLPFTPLLGYWYWYYCGPHRHHIQQQRLRGITAHSHRNTSVLFEQDHT